MPQGMAPQAYKRHKIREKKQALGTRIPSEPEIAKDRLRKPSRLKDWQAEAWVVGITQADKAL